MGTGLGIRARAYMDRGEYVPDDLVVRMVMNRLEQPDADKGFILDGFPRTVPQAVALEAALEQAERPPRPCSSSRSATTWPCVACPTGGPARRASARTTWSSPPVDDQVGDADGVELERRADDEELTVRRRQAVYRDQTEPLEGFYRDRGLLREIDVEALEDEVATRMMLVLEDMS